MTDPPRMPYVAPSIRDYGDLVEVTAQVGGGFSDVPQGAPDRHRLPGPERSVLLLLLNAVAGGSAS